MTARKRPPQTKITAEFTHLDWQRAPWLDKAPILLLTGGAGGGKSSLAAEKIHAYCMKYPNAVGIGIRKAREFAAKSVVYAIQKAIGEDPSVKYAVSEMLFRYAN